jgi:glycosyltransferase involved in cell wall biosynthesis
MKPLVSVIIPTYNRPGPLCELVECLTRQSCPAMEIIVINDNGSNPDFIQNLYPELNIRVVNMAANIKHVAARNVGLSFASGEYIMLCDDDDLIVPTHINTMLDEIEQGYDLVYSDVEIVEFRSEGATRIPLKRSLFAYEYDRQAMRKFSTFVPSGCLYRRILHERIGGFDEQVYHYWDWDFLLRVSENHLVKRVPVAGTLYSFASAGDNLSGAVTDMEPYLDRLCDKHGLGKLPTKNFFLLLEEPEVKQREASSEIVWDGQPIVSRWACCDSGVSKSG